MKETIYVLEVKESATSAGAPMLQVKTNNGIMGTFYAELFDELKAAIGKNIEVEVERKGKYANIKDVYGQAGGTPFTPSHQPVGKSSNIDDKIMAQVAFKGAIELIVAGKNVIGDKTLNLEDISKECLRVLKELTK